jgi:hypothetical protein
MYLLASVTVVIVEPLFRRDSLKLIVAGQVCRRGIKFLLQLLLYEPKKSISSEYLDAKKENTLVIRGERTFSLSSTHSAGVDNTATYLP